MLSVTAFPGHQRVFALLACLLLSGVAAAQTQLPGIDAKWRYLRSENFEMFSRNGEKESRRLLHNLELVHAIFFETYGFKPVRAVPVTVYFFSRDRHFEFYKHESLQNLDNLRTYYHAEPDRGYLVVAPLPDYAVAQQLAFGGYTYHLFRLTGELPPLWYTHGVAGIFRNLVIRPKEFELGRPDGNQVGRLRREDLIPIDVMFGSDQNSSFKRSDQGNRRFQDQSWALVHYLYFGNHGRSKEGVARFLEHATKPGPRFDAGVTRQIFEQSVGLTFEDMNRELRRYFLSGDYAYSKYPLPAVAAAKSYETRNVSREEIHTRLAELAVRVNDAPLGKLHLLHATDHPAEAARAQEVLAAAAEKEGDWNQAMERWERALAAGSDNPAVVDRLLEYENKTRFHRIDAYYRLPKVAEEKLRRWLEQSLARSPEQSLGYEMLAWVEATAEKPRIANVNLVQSRFARLKNKQKTLFALILVRVRLEDRSGAEELLDSLGQMADEPWVYHATEQVRSILEKRPADYRGLPPMSRGGDTPGGAVEIQVSPPLL